MVIGFVGGIVVVVGMGGIGGLVVGVVVLLFWMVCMIDGISIFFSRLIV